MDHQLDGQEFSFNRLRILSILSRLNPDGLLSSLFPRFLRASGR